MTPNRPKPDTRAFYILHLILLDNEPQIGRKPIKRDFIFNFVEKWVPDRPKADKKGYYILNLILL